MTSDDPGQQQPAELMLFDHQPLERDIGPVRIIAVGFNIPNSWVAIAASLSIAIAAGGPVSVIYGTLVSCVFYACAAVTMAELASVYPTAGGQYHFTSILAPQRFNRSLAYICGMIATISWAINAASVAMIASQFITAFPQYFNHYQPQNWHLFLIYQALNLLALFYNLFVIKRTNWIHDFACKYTPLFLPHSDRRLQSFSLLTMVCNSCIDIVYVCYLRDYLSVPK